MNDRITAGAAALMGSLIAATGMVRWAVRPVPARGRHRREYGAAAPQQLVHCPACGGTTSATVHGQLIRCTDGHQIGGQA